MKVIQIILYLYIYKFVVSGLSNRYVITQRPLYGSEHFNGFDNNFRICVHAPIIAPKDDEDITFYENGQQVLLGYQMWADYVNFEKKGLMIGSELWGVELVVIESFKSQNTVAENSDKCLADEFGSMDWMFPTYSSSLTKPALDRTENASKILLAAGSNLDYVWTEYVKNGYTFSVDEGSYYAYALPEYAVKGASRIAYFCNDAVGQCTPSDIQGLNNSAKENGMQVLAYNFIDSFSSSYKETLMTAVDSAKNLDTDIIIIIDFDVLCIDIIEYLRNINWTPAGLFFTICNGAPATMAAIGELYVQYTSSYLSFISDANYTSGISGYSPSYFTELFSFYSNRDEMFPIFGSRAFAAGEVIQAAIEMQARLNASLVRDTAAISGLIRNGSWPTILGGNLTFGPRHIAQHQLYTFQYERDLKYSLISESSPLVYPMPSWVTRECSAATENCAGHGVCVEATCVCEDGYYGLENPKSCDTYCSGKILSGSCLSDRTYYVGAMLDYSIEGSEELAAHLNLAVELINNKTNKWFAENVQQVTLRVRLNDSSCDAEKALEMLNHQQEWAYNVSSGKVEELDGLIAAYCSAASESLASHGARISLPQISAFSSLTTLSNKELYPYFSRTCQDNQALSEALIDLFENLGLIPNIAIVSDSSSFSIDLHEQFMTEWLKRGYELLGDVLLSSDSDYASVADEIASFGSPVIFLALYDAEAEKVLLAAESHIILGSGHVVFAGAEWTSDGRNISRASFQGVLNLAPYSAISEMFQSYLSLWQILDPTLYPDTDGDRTSITAEAGSLVDAVFSLALAYQHTINDNVNYDGEKMRQYVVQKMRDNVRFEGVTGEIDFNIYGDQTYSAFSLFSFHDADNQMGYFVNVGDLIKDTVSNKYIPYLNYSNILWPDGTSGYTQSYSAQLNLYCPPGFSVVESIGVRSCAACSVGTYKPYSGSQPCDMCPEGADCNNIGIVVPCILPGYWRDAAASIDIGDFEKYPVFSCDVEDGCLGGCSLNNSCASGRLSTSPTCGVCTKYHFLNQVGDCQECDEMQSTGAIVTGYTLGFVIVCVAIFLLFFLQVKTISSESGKASALRFVLEKINAEEAFPKVACTAQLLLSFSQVLTGVNAHLKVGWPKKIESVFNFFSLDFIEPLTGANYCHESDSYLLNLVMWFICPIIVVVTSAVIASVVYYGYVRKNTEVELVRHNHALKLWNLYFKIFLCVCFIFFPPVSYAMLTSLQCRDFGVTGSFVRVDYSVDCSSSTYQSIIWLSTLGICIYSIGIPLLFGLVIRNRNNFLFERPSKLLYENYKDSFCYFEIFDMVRKFLLTSMLIFVTEPGRPSMALYLLIVNAVALRILCSFHPFRHLCDNILCIFLVSVECLVFLVAFIILSDVSEVDGYSENDIFASVFAIILTAVCLVAPLMFALKFDFCSKIFQSRFEQIFVISRLSWNGPSNQQQHDSKIELQIIAEVNPIASRITD